MSNQFCVVKQHVIYELRTLLSIEMLLPWWCSM